MGPHCVLPCSEIQPCEIIVYAHLIRLVIDGWRLVAIVGVIYAMSLG